MSCFSAVGFARIGFARQQPEEEVQAPRRLPERIALDVEDDVARRGPRQLLEAASRLDGQRVPVETPAGTPAKLQPGLVVKGLERVGGNVLDRCRRRLGELLQCLEACRAQVVDLAAADTGHQQQVIILLPSFVADLAELAQRAVLDAVGLGRRGVGERREKAGADATVVGGEVGVAQGAPLADSEQDVHLVRCGVLDGGDRLRVEAELQHVGRLLRSRELGVEGFVAPGAQRRRLVDAL